MKKNLKTIVMLSLAIISVVAVTFAFSGAWFTDSDSKTATITVGKKVEISVDATVPEDTTILPGSKFEITDIVGVAAADVSSMYVRASVEVENTYANVLTPTTTSTGWVELDGYFYYSSADSLTADSTLSNLTELVAGNSTGSLSLTLNVSREATQEPTDETYLAPGATVTVTITFEAIQSANTDKKTIKQIWPEVVALNIDGTDYEINSSATTLQDLINAYNAANSESLQLSDSTTCGWFADKELMNSITPTDINDYSNILISDYSGFYTKTVDAEMLANITFNLGTNQYALNEINASVTELVIPAVFSEDGVNYYPIVHTSTGAFKTCTVLTSVTFPSCLRTIWLDSFNNCELLQSINIPNSALYIYKGDGYSMKINISEDNPRYCLVDDILFSKDKTELVSFPDNTATSYTIPDSVRLIRSYAFKGCSGLKSVNIPSGVTQIGSSAFSGCTSLESVNIPSGVTSIESSAFSGCTSLESVNIPNGVTKIETSTFENCSSLSNIEIPSGVLSIGDKAFYNCSALESVNIPSGVTEIGYSAFSKCALLEIDLRIPSGVTIIERQAFYGCKKLKSVIIPLSVTEIGDKAFNSCSALTAVFYEGTESDKSAITIGTVDTYFSNITWHYAGEWELVDGVPTVIS